MHDGLRRVVYGLLSGTGHADVIAFSQNESQLQKAINILYSADTSRFENTIFLALNSGLKYEIQVPNIGGSVLWHQL